MPVTFATGHVERVRCGVTDALTIWNVISCPGHCCPSWSMRFGEFGYLCTDFNTSLPTRVRWFVVLLIATPTRYLFVFYGCIRGMGHFIGHGYAVNRQGKEPSALHGGAYFSNNFIEMIFSSSYRVPRSRAGVNVYSFVCIGKPPAENF